MKRYLPFLIIVAAALLTIGAGAMLYRAKQRAAVTANASSNAVTANATKPAATSEDKTAHIRGGPNAAVTLEIFGDFQCPSCAAVSGVISGLEHEYGSRLRVIFRQFPLAMHAHAVDAALAAEAAGLQGHFWEMHDMLYQYQSVWSRASDPKRFFAAYAGSLGLDVERFREDSDSDELRTRVVTEGEDGVTRGVKNTPTIFINGQMVQSAFTPEALHAAIDAAMAGKKSS